MNTIIETPDRRLDNAHEDEDLERRVRLYLTHTGHRPINALTVEVENGVITLRGRVPSYYARQLAIACAKRVAGVRQVNDQIRASLPSKIGG